MQIRQGRPKQLRKAKGWKKKKVWKKTNQWFYCPYCLTLTFFRVFKCRFDLESPITCECGSVLKAAPAKICHDAKLLFPHFKNVKKRDECKHWYHDIYLRSSLWRSIRLRVLTRDDNTCQCCREAADVVHHKSYDEEVMIGNRDGDLISLCFECHEFIEFDGDRKTTLAEANERLESNQLGFYCAR